MKTLIIIFLISMFYISGFSQKIESLDTIKSYTWTNSLAYLPSIYGESEIYKYKHGRLKHKYSKTKGIWRLRWNSKKIFTTKNKNKVSDSFDMFLKISDNKTFKIGLLKEDKDSLIAMSKQKNYLGFPLHSADYNDLKKYITNKDTIEIEIKEFNTDYSKTIDAMTTVIDGVPFWINLDIVVQKNDTLKYEYVGNLYDGVEDTSVDEFLTFYYIYQHHKLFKYTPMDKYFDNENLYKVILRYIAYKENKVDRENYLRLGY